MQSVILFFVDVQMVEKVNAPAKAVTPADGKKKVGKPRNYDLGNGVYRFSRSKMFHKKAVYKFLDKKTPKTVCNFLNTNIKL